MKNSKLLYIIDSQLLVFIDYLHILKRIRISLPALDVSQILYFDNISIHIIVANIIILIIVYCHTYQNVHFPYVKITKNVNKINYILKYAFISWN